MQGTVASYDEDTRSGSVFLDDGTRLTFGAGAMEDNGLRHLRAGQRVTVTMGSEQVQRIQILTLP